jgi:hypothetical protein
VQGNYIGTDQAALAGVPNGEWGIRVIDATTITVGGSAVGAGNVIAFNGGAGLISPFSGGVGVLGDTSAGVRIVGNRIEQNIGLGIDLDTDDVTANDALDADGGPNGRQNVPAIAAVVNAGTTQITGSLESEVGTTYEVDAYSSLACDASGFGEGRVHLGSFSVITNGLGIGAFAGQSLGVLVPSGQFITLTATAPNGSTSEFSACVIVP